MTVTTTQTAIDRARLRDLYDDYTGLLDGDDLEAWLDLFIEDCDYRVLARENDRANLPLATMRADSRAMLSDRVAAIRSTQFFADRVMRHFTSGIRIVSHDGDAVHVTASFCVIESLADEPSRIHMAGEHCDRVVDDGTALRFATKRAVYDAPLVLTSLIFPV